VILKRSYPDGCLMSVRHGPSFLWRFVFCLFFVNGLIPAFSAHAFESEAKQAYLFDTGSHTVLYAKNSKQQFEPGAMVKLMSMAVIFDALKAGHVSLDDEFPVTEEIWRKGGAPSGNNTMFAKPNSVISVKDLLYGASVIHAHDAILALALGIDRSETLFTVQMHEIGRRLGMASSRFENATGLSHPNQMTTLQDMAKLVDYVTTVHKNRLPLFTMESFRWNRITQSNKNPLMGEIEGLQGFFHSYNEKDGYGFIGSVERNGRKVIVLFNGMDTPEGRVQEAERLVKFAFEDFQLVQLARPDEAVAYVDVHGGQTPTVKLIGARGAIDLLVPPNSQARLRYYVRTQQPLVAPVTKGTPAGQLVVMRNGVVIRENDLVIGDDVAKGSFIIQSRDGLKHLLFGWLRDIELPWRPKVEF
jgi:D-alanyl-D-alanine carboxypeptidase (penicillin-binding protein 5/6)